MQKTRDTGQVRDVGVINMGVSFRIIPELGRF